MPVFDMVGKTFGHLLVLEQRPAKGATLAARWLCRCSCGVEKEIVGSNLRRGTTVSCGHVKLINDKKKLAAIKAQREENWKQLVGEHFGLLKVLAIFSKNDRFYAACQCGCGNKKDVVVQSLTRKQATDSCGCLSAKQAGARLKRYMSTVQIVKENGKIIAHEKHDD